MIIILTLILLTSITGMYVYKSINPFYALFEWIHSTYWWILSKGAMALHPKDPKFKYLKMCNKIHCSIKHLKLFKWLDHIDHNYGSKLRYKMKWKMLMGDVYIKPNGCPECGSDLKCTVGVAVMCTNWQHPHTKDWYCKGGKRNCNYSLMAG